MRKIIVFILVIVVAFLAYQQYGPKKPEFREIRNVQIEELSNKKVVVIADAMIYNPNITNIEVTDIDLKVSVNEHEAGNAVGIMPAVVGKAGEEFAVPIRATFHPGEVLKNEGLLGSIAGLLGQKRFKTAYVGDITVKVLFINFDVPVKGEGEIGK